MNKIQDRQLKDFAEELGRIVGTRHDTQAPSVPVGDTGAVRGSDLAGLRYDLISGVALKRLAQTCAEGAEKYREFNWLKGMPVRDLLNHAIAHIYNFLDGDRSEDHLGHAFWGLMAAAHSEACWPHLNQNLIPPQATIPPETEDGPDGTPR